VRTDPAGNAVWEKRLPGVEREARIQSIQVAADGGIVAAGYGGVGEGRLLLIELEPTGEVRWEKAYGVPFLADTAHCVRPTSDGGWIVAGQSKGEMYLVKTDGAGEKMWESWLPSGIRSSGRAVLEAPDGGYVVAGTAGEAGSAYDSGYVVKVTPAGKKEWTMTFGDPLYGGYGAWVDRGPEGGFLVVGGIMTIASSEDIYLLVRYNFQHGPAPAAPFPACGTSGAATGLGCEAFPPCP
jgi:hypothetical protein